MADNENTILTEENESTRIINLSEASEMDAGMYFVTDSSNGTRKVPITKLIDANLEDEYAAAPAKEVGDLKEDLSKAVGYVETANNWVKATSSGNRYDIVLGQDNNEYKVIPANGLWVALQGFTTSDYSGSAAYQSELATSKLDVATKSSETGYYYRLRLGHNVSADISESDRNNSKVYVVDNLLTDRVVSLENSVEAVQEILGITEDFFVDEVKSVAETVQGLTTKPCLTYNIITDTHLRPASADSVRQTYDSIANITAVNRLSYADGVVHLGDTVSHSMYTEDGATNDEIFKTMRDYVKRFNDINQHSYIINGNHDGKQANVYQQYEWYALCGRLNTEYTVKEGGTNYFYKDYPDIKTRCIFLATPDNIDNEAGAFYGYTYRLLHWLATVALDTPNDYGVIMFAHIAPFFTWYLPDGMRERTTFYGICNAYHNHTTFTGGIQNANFSSKTGTKLVAYICGHAHGDAVLEAGETVGGVDENGNPVTTTNDMPCPVINIGCGAFSTGAMSNYGAVAPSRTDKTVTQDLWDTMVYRPDLNKIYMVRFGAGNDREVDVN